MSDVIFVVPIEKLTIFTNNLHSAGCGHCKKMKPEYEKAATIMKEQKIYGVLAALDATKESAIGAQFGVKGYPTVKYFVNGEFKFDVRVREADKIVEFMKV